VKKQKASSGGKVLIILIGLVMMVVLVGGVIWSTQKMKTDSPVAQVPVAKRMKVPPMPEPQRMKVPLALPQMENAQPSEPAQTRATVNPVVSAVLPVPPPPREVTDPSALPAPQPEEEIRDAVALDEAPPSVTTTSDTPTPEKAEIVQSAQESSQTLPSAASSQTTLQSGAAATTERYNLQVGAYRQEANAQAAVAKLSKKGYSPFLLEITDARKRTWYTVRIGRFETRENAATSLNNLKRKENIAAVIAKAGKL